MASPRSAHFSGIRELAAIAGTRFRRGVVLCHCSQPVPFGPNLHALPLSELWS